MVETIAHLQSRVERKAQREAGEGFALSEGLQRGSAAHLIDRPSFIVSDCPIQISAPLREPLPSSLLVNMTAFILYVVFRSTLHQGLDWLSVRVQELCVKLESLLPSTALPAAADSFVEDCSASFPSAKFCRRLPDGNKQQFL